MAMDRTIPSYGALLAVKYASRVLYDVREEWVGDVPDDPWSDVRLVAVLHHTSLAEAVYLAVVPNRLLRKVARHAVLPVARETMARPIEGRIFKLLIPNAVPITRKRDESWAKVMAEIDDPDAMVVMFPEGRMMRPSGRDKHGGPMTVKPGITDVLLGLRHGRMILAYSGGLHHVFRPGASLPSFLKVLHLRLEAVDIATYIEERRRERLRFNAAVVRDLTRRRDLYTPVAVGTPEEVRAEVLRRRKHALSDRNGDAGSGDGDEAARQPATQGHDRSSR